jgi:hypothetical protein
MIYSDKHCEGETVTIYEDPVTKMKPEGNAKLIRFVQALPNGLEEWSVRFQGEQAKYFRTI